jgi:hypothetical protein
MVDLPSQTAQEGEIHLVDRQGEVVGGDGGAKTLVDVDQLTCGIAFTPEPLSGTARMVLTR